MGDTARYGATGEPAFMRAAARFAYAAAILFALHLISYFIPALRDATLGTAPALAVLEAALAIAQHAVILPVVAALPAPRWARIAAYTWILGDIVSDVLQMGGSQQYLTLRLIVNVLAALWILAASWSAPRTLRIIGIFVALDLISYSLTAPLGAFAVLVSLPSLVLAPVWFWLVGRRLTELAQQSAVVAQQS